MSEIGGSLVFHFIPAPISFIVYHFSCCNYLLAMNHGPHCRLVSYNRTTCQPATCFPYLFEVLFVGIVKLGHGNEQLYDVNDLIEDMRNEEYK